MGAGPRAARPRQPRQARKGATVREPARVPRVNPASVVVLSRGFKSKEKMLSSTLSPDLLAALALGGILLGATALVLAIRALLRLGKSLPGLVRLLQIHDDLIGGAAGRASERIAAIEEALRAAASRGDESAARIATLEGLARIDLSLVGFVRYDAYEDTGSTLSYALALLNREGDGVVLNSIYSRSETRTYGKSVRGFLCESNASGEEISAIAIAKESATRGALAVGE